MMKCEWCECELTEPETHCDDCAEMLNAAYEDESRKWPEYISPEEE